MRRFLLLFPVVALFGCTTTSRKTVSGWYALEKAQDVRCAPWPLRERDP